MYTHLFIIYIYIYIEREKERERERDIILHYIMKCMVLYHVTYKLYDHGIRSKHLNTYAIMSQWRTVANTLCNALYDYMTPGRPLAGLSRSRADKDLADRVHVALIMCIYIYIYIYTYTLAKFNSYTNGFSFRGHGLELSLQPVAPPPSSSGQDGLQTGFKVLGLGFRISGLGFRA